MLKWFWISTGTLSVMGALLVIWTPVPLGLPLLLIGVPLLMKYSPTFRRLVLQLAHQFPSFGRYLKRIMALGSTGDEPPQS